MKAYQFKKREEQIKKLFMVMIKNMKTYRFEDKDNDKLNILSTYQ